MKQLTGNQIRQMFLDYFKSKGHMIEPGASLIPHNDPTLLWINAGVAALKKYFDGSEKPASNRIANAQKSIRTMILKMLGVQLVTTHSLKCWVTSQLEIILRMKLSSSHGNF